MKTIIIALLLAVTIQTQGNAEAKIDDPGSTSKALYDQCRAFLRLDDGNGYAAEANKAIECLVYIRGYIDGYDIKKRLPKICFDPEKIVDTGHATKAFARYMDERLDLWSHHRALLLLAAFEITFPCDEE